LTQENQKAPMLKPLDNYIQFVLFPFVTLSGLLYLYNAFKRMNDLSTRHFSLRTFHSNSAVKSIVDPHPQLLTLTLINYSNTPFRISLFYKDPEGQDYEEEYDVPVILPAFHRYVAPSHRSHHNHLMHLIGVQLFCVDNPLNAEYEQKEGSWLTSTFVLSEIMSHLDTYWHGKGDFPILTDDGLQNMETSVCHDLKFINKIPTFVITKHVGEPIRLYFCEQTHH